MSFPLEFQSILCSFSDNIPTFLKAFSDNIPMVLMSFYEDIIKPVLRVSNSVKFKAVFRKLIPSILKSFPEALRARFHDLFLSGSEFAKPRF